jgi:Protein of unknown function (DUF1573)
MKKAVLFFSAFILSFSLFAQQSTTTPPAPVLKPPASEFIKFKELSYDFGKIKQNIPVNHDFVFTNIYNGSIVIDNAVASCGCTTPVKPQAAVLKGKEDKINAGFNASNPGPFNKTITVTVDGAGDPIVLRITGEVIPAATPTVSATAPKS